MQQKTILGAIIVIVLIACGFAVWKLSTPNTSTSVSTDTSASQVDKATLTQLQADLQNVTPHFIDSSKANGQILTPEEQKIKDDVVALFLVGQPSNDKDYYSGLWLDAVGTRYILASQPSAESSYDEIIDSQTGKATPIPQGVRFNLASKSAMLYIAPQAIYTYMLDHAATNLVTGSQLSDTETYHSGEADMPDVIPHQTHTDTSITISVFDSSKRAPNPALGQGATMNGEVRKVTLSY